MKDVRKKRALQKAAGAACLIVLGVVYLFLRGGPGEDIWKENASGEAGEELSLREEASGESSGETFKEISEETFGETSGETGSIYEEFSASDMPAFEGETYAVIHNNEPFFTEEEIGLALETGAYESYSPLDSLGRCGAAAACLGRELMPTEPRGEIYWIRPSGWQKASGYERSHLIAFQLAGENDNEQNLVTGTHFFNHDGMRPFEEMVGDYIRETDSHVLYRVTPLFEGEELMCRGVLMEALSLEDSGKGICYCVVIYNCFSPEEGKTIDYQTGKVLED